MVRPQDHLLVGGEAAALCPERAALGMAAFGGHHVVVFRCDPRRDRAGGRAPQAHRGHYDPISLSDTEMKQIMLAKKPLLQH